MSESIIPSRFDGELSQKVRDTLTEILKDPTINETFGGGDERLSAAQAGLAAAVTAKMQERLIEEIRESHKRELGLISGFWRLYKTPILQLGTPVPERSAKDSGPFQGRFGGLFSWGNVIGGAALILVAVAFYYTKLTWSYEQQWKNAESELTDLRTKYSSEEKANEGLQTELATAVAKAEAFETSLRTITANATDQQQQLLNAITGLSTQRGELAKELAASSGERKFQKLYEGAVSELKNTRQDNATLLAKFTKCEEQMKPKP